MCNNTADLLRKLWLGLHGKRQALTFPSEAVLSSPPSQIKHIPRDTELQFYSYLPFKTLSEEKITVHSHCFFFFSLTRYLALAYH